MDIIRDAGKLSLKGFCDHCGNLTFQSMLHDETVPWDNNVSCTYTLCRCTICHGIVLRRHPEDWHAPLRPGEDAKSTDIDYMQLWPPPLSLPTEAPARVRKIYEEARLVKRHSASSFVVQIGRALEAVMNDIQADGRTLARKLNWLVEQRRLPELFGEMGHLNRIIRNWGAHDAEIDVEPEDVEIVDVFFNAIIEYLYVAPAKVKRVSELITERKSS